MEKIKEDKFFAGFIEINAMSIILNRPIIILENLEYNNNIYLKKLASFINNEFDKINLDDIIFINFINKNHYQFLTPNKNFIKNRINKITIPPIKQLIIVNISPKNQNNCINFNNKNNNKLIKENKVIISHKNKELTNSDNESENKPLKSEEYLDIGSSYADNYANLNNKSEIYKKINLKEYSDTLKTYKENNQNIYDNDNKIIIEIPKYPILVGNKIDQNYYRDIFRY